MIKVRLTFIKTLQIASALVLSLSLVAALLPETASAASNNSYGCSSYYKVRKGDTLSEIAARYGVNYHSLARANGIYNANHIYYGQKLCITGGGYYKNYGYNHKYYKKGYDYDYDDDDYYKPSYNKHYYKPYYKSYYNKGYYNKHYYKPYYKSYYNKGYYKHGYYKKGYGY